MGRHFLIVAGLFLLGVLGIVIAMTGRKRRGRTAPQQQLELLACGDCGYLNRPNARYCAQCGGSLADNDLDSD